MSAMPIKLSKNNFDFKKQAKIRCAFVSSCITYALYDFYFCATRRKIDKLLNSLPGW